MPGLSFLKKWPYYKSIKKNGTKPFIKVDQDREDMIELGRERDVFILKHLMGVVKN